MAPSLKTTINKINRTLENNVRIANKVIEENVRNVTKAAKKVPWLHVVIGVVAVGIILYCIWKLLRPRSKKEKFATSSAPNAPSGWSRYMYADVRQESGGSKDVSRVDLGQTNGLAITSNDINTYVTNAGAQSCNAFSIFNDFSGRTILIYKQIQPNASCESRPDPNSVVMYIKNDANGKPIIEPSKCGTLQWTHLLTTNDLNAWKNNVEQHVAYSEGAKAVIAPGTQPLVNVSIDWAKANNVTENQTLGACYGKAPSTQGATHMVWQRNDPVDGEALGKCGTCTGFDVCAKNDSQGKFTVIHVLKEKSVFEATVAAVASAVGLGGGAVGTPTPGTPAQTTITWDSTNSIKIQSKKRIDWKPSWLTQDMKWVNDEPSEITWIYKKDGGIPHIYNDSHGKLRARTDGGSSNQWIELDPHTLDWDNHFVIEQWPGESYFKIVYRPGGGQRMDGWMVAVGEQDILYLSENSDDTTKWNIKKIDGTSNPTDSSATCGEGKRGNGKCPDPNACCSTSGWCGYQDVYKSTLNSESKCKR